MIKIMNMSNLLDINQAIFQQNTIYEQKYLVRNSFFSKKEMYF
jgi:hypothetical protein